VSSYLFSSKVKKTKLTFTKIGFAKNSSYFLFFIKYMLHSAFNAYAIDFLKKIKNTLTWEKIDNYW